MRLFFWPDRPGPNLLLAEMIEWAGWSVVDHPDEADACMVQADTTVIADHVLEPWLAESTGWLNGRCRDISKSTVARCFEAAFGYPLLVDPLAWRGPMMVKSERNFRKDGRVISGPVSSRNPGMCYQRYIDNRQPDGTYLDWRLHVAGGEVLPGYRHRWRPGGPVIWSWRDHVWEPLDPSEIISWEESLRITRFLELLGMEFGGIDLLRDAADGLLYIIDANTTPGGLEWAAWGPPGEPITWQGQTGQQVATAPLGPTVMPAVTTAFQRAFGKRQ